MANERATHAYFVPRRAPATVTPRRAAVSMIHGNKHSGPTTSDQAAAQRRESTAALLSSRFPACEVGHTRAGKLVCLVCPWRPVLDTAQVMAVHRAGKKHREQSMVRQSAEFESALRQGKRKLGEQDDAGAAEVLPPAAGGSDGSTIAALRKRLRAAREGLPLEFVAPAEAPLGPTLPAPPRRALHVKALPRPAPAHPTSPHSAPTRTAPLRSVPAPCAPPAPACLHGPASVSLPSAPTPVAAQRAPLSDEQRRAVDRLLLAGYHRYAWHTAAHASRLRASITPCARICCAATHLGSLFVTLTWKLNRTRRWSWRRWLPRCGVGHSCTSCILLHSRRAPPLVLPQVGARDSPLGWPEVGACAALATRARTAISG